MTTPVDPKHNLKKLLLPLLFSILLGVLMYFGGEASQTFGLAALDTTRVIIGYLLGIAEFVVLAIFLRRVVQYVLLDGLVASALGTPAPRLLSQLSAFLIYLLAITAILGVVFKKDLTFILAASGAAGIVIGMALKELILDVFAGLSINLDHAVRMGDCIQLHQAGDQTIEGRVIEISWRTTRVADRFNNIVIIPNSRLASLTITNFSQPQDFLETSIVVFLDIEIPTERAIRVLQAAAIEAMSHFAAANTPSPSVAVKDITADGVKYGVYLYPTFESRFRARNSTYQCILRHLKTAGLRPALLKREHLTERTHDEKDFYQPNLNHLADLIGATELFQDLAAEELQLLATTSSLRQVPAGTQITQAGEVATVMFLVIEGLLSVEIKFRRSGTSHLPKSEILSPGSLIGGNAMISGDTYETTIYSKSTALLCEIDHNVLGQLLLHKPDLAHILSHRVAAQLAQSNATPLSQDTGNQWQTNEEELAVDVLSSLKRSFAHLRLS